MEIYLQAQPMVKSKYSIRTQWNWSKNLQLIILFIIKLNSKDNFLDQWKIMQKFGQSLYLLQIKISIL